MSVANFPGDPNDKPTAQEIAEYPKIQAAFRKFRSGPAIA